VPVCYSLCSPPSPSIPQVIREAQASQVLKLNPHHSFPLVSGYKAGKGALFVSPAAEHDLKRLRSLVVASGEHPVTWGRIVATDILMGLRDLHRQVRGEGVTSRGGRGAARGWTGSDYRRMGRWVGPATQGPTPTASDAIVLLHD